MTESVLDQVGVRDTSVLAPATPPVRFEDDPELLAEVLKPYKTDCKYLKSATVSIVNGLATAQGEFSIPYSCYIDDTGHLNAVEFNICFNQIMYYLIAKCVKESAIPEFAGWTMEDYWERQLPDILIASLTSEFRRSIESSAFSGECSFATITERNVRRPMLIVDMPCRFWDANGGRAEGNVQMALLNPPGGLSEVASA